MCHRTQSISFEYRVALVVADHILLSCSTPVGQTKYTQPDTFRNHMDYPLSIQLDLEFMSVLARLNTLCTGNCISVRGDLQTSMHAFRAREGTSIKSHPNVVTREPEVETEDGGHQVGRLPHPRVLHQVPRKRLPRMEGGNMVRNG